MNRNKIVKKKVSPDAAFEVLDRLMFKVQNSVGKSQEELDKICDEAYAEWMDLVEREPRTLGDILDFASDGSRNSTLPIAVNVRDELYRVIDCNVDGDKNGFETYFILEPIEQNASDYRGISLAAAVERIHRECAFDDWNSLEDPFAAICALPIVFHMQLPIDCTDEDIDNAEFFHLCGVSITFDAVADAPCLLLFTEKEVF